jgi:hypothetical protein
MQEIVTAKAQPRPAQMYTLEISQEVAETLAIVCRRIGGSPDGKSRRTHTDRILSALVGAGAIVSEDVEGEVEDTGLSKNQLGTNTIYFHDFKGKK